MADRGQKAGKRKENAAAQYQQAPLPDISEDPHDRLDQASKNARQAERQSDLKIIQMQIRADERPGGSGHTENQLVQELDQQENQIHRWAVNDSGMSYG